MRCVRGAAAVAVLAAAIGAWAPTDASAVAPTDRTDLGGTPVDASTDPGEPTSIDAGLWAVTLGSESAPLHFAYQRQIQGSTIHVGAIGAPQGTLGDGLAIAATDADIDDPEGDDCGSDTASTDSSAPYATFGGQVIVGNEIDTPDSTCSTADTVAITLGRYGGYNEEDLPVALKIVEEAPVSDRGEPAPETEELDFRVPEPGDPADGPAGSPSYDDAPLLDLDGDTFTLDTTVTEGTELLWRVPVAWGDQLAARVDLPALDSDDAEALGSPSSYLRVALVQPSREVFAPTLDDYSYGYYGGTEASRLVVGTYPLRYTNRFTSDVVPTLPGDHWVSITVADAPEDRAAIDVPVELTVAVTPTDAQPPTYQAAVLAQGGGPGPAAYSADKPYLVGKDRFAAVASGNPAPQPSEDDVYWWTARHVTGLGLGVVSLVCCVIGAGWLVRRRAASR
ncbi:hypothetical protein F0U44_21145 [Nocardioides humilatus]|uniref:Peptidase n=1 Tax=Nocardioides humilatus TaxID=2607660 RepID=A0A5B1L6T6_9ACTN|nr:hypothetical protein [Nocardioides humilatus]KAA1415490.1 hypothetical protein F0U44_21145 [Nocardioides humilatus]